MSNVLLFKENNGMNYMHMTAQMEAVGLRSSICRRTKKLPKFVPDVKDADHKRAGIHTGNLLLSLEVVPRSPDDNELTCYVAPLDIFL